MAQAQTAVKTPKAKAVAAPKAAPRKRPTKAEKLAASADATAQTPKMPDASNDKHEIVAEQRVADRRADTLAAGDNVMKFATAQLAAPDAAKQAAFEAELAALKIKHNVNAEVIVKAPKATKVMQNGITRPAEQTQCGKIWALADEISHKQHTVAAIATVREHPSMKEVNDHTIKTQYAKWRRFNGISGRLPTIHAVHQELPAVGYDDLTPHVATPPAPKQE